MQSLRWDDLRVLLALYRKGSLKRGAEEIGVNISTMSRRLDALETATGVHLFDRTPDGTHPTAAAEQLLPFAESMERAAVGLAQGLESFEVAPEGDVTITAPPGVVDHFIAPALVEFHRAHPKIRLRIDSSIGYADLTRREADLALRLIRPTAGDLVSTRLASYGYCVVASKKHSAALGRLRDPDATPWTTWGDDLAQLPDRRWIMDNVDRSQIVLLTSSMTAQLEAVRAGLGATLVPVPYRDLPGLAEVQCAPKLRRSVAALPHAGLWLVGHRALRDVPRIAAVWAWLKRRYEMLR